MPYNKGDAPTIRRISVADARYMTGTAVPSAARNMTDGAGPAAGDRVLSPASRSDNGRQPVQRHLLSGSTMMTHELRDINAAYRHIDLTFDRKW